MSDIPIAIAYLTTSFALLMTISTILKAYHQRPDVRTPLPFAWILTALVVASVTFLVDAFFGGIWPTFATYSPPIVFAIAAVFGAIWLSTFVHKVSSLPTRHEFL